MVYTDSYNILIDSSIFLCGEIKYFIKIRVCVHPHGTNTGLFVCFFLFFFFFPSPFLSLNWMESGRLEVVREVVSKSALLIRLHNIPSLTWQKIGTDCPILTTGRHWGTSNAVRRHWMASDWKQHSETLVSILELLVGLRCNNRPKLFQSCPLLEVLEPPKPFCD